MAVCCFDNDYDNVYNCEYSVSDNGIEVNVEYDISEEIVPDSNGVKSFGVNTTFDKRDILIIDSDNKINYLLKDAYNIGFKEVWGSINNKSTSRFKSSCYINHKDVNKLTSLLKTPKAKKIRIYSKLINDFIGYPSVEENLSGNEYIIKLKKDLEKKTINIGCNNIKSISVSDDWNYTHNNKNRDINIRLSGFIEIETYKRVNYNEIYKYIRELILYIELYKPNKFKIENINICVDDIYYGYHDDIRETEYRSYYRENSVKDNILSFLYKCYTLIPYRNGSSEIRNIPYIIFDYSRNIEDTFLMLYRTIECYYKKQNIVNNFINYSINNNYKNNNNYDIDKLSKEIICLRNHYIHSGYYIKNGNLKISFDDVSLNYNANVNFDFIFDRVKIMYEIVIDIIFRCILGYSDYKFEGKY